MAAPRSEYLDALSFGVDERRLIAEALKAYQAQVYLSTLQDLADRYGGEPPLTLGEGIVRALDDASVNQANLMVGSYNRNLADFLARQDLSDPVLLLQRAEEWARRRSEALAPVTAVTESYAAHADATVAFFDQAGATTTFDFGGHGDAAPECPICKVVKAGNPWTGEEVVEIGTPHPNCRQTWHARAKKIAISEHAIFGGAGAAGIVGGTPLVIRAGSVEEAVAIVEGMRP